jgi:hypothetical protein
MHDVHRPRDSWNAREDVMNTPSTPHSHAGEVYVSLADSTAAFPAVIADERWNGFARPRFTRHTTAAVAAWLTARSGIDDNHRVTARFHGTILTITELSGNDTERVAPDQDGRYPLGAGGWMWQLATPLPDVVAESALLADSDRLIPVPGEFLVSINIDGSDPAFPALASAVHGWSQAGAPRFRPEVAEVVVAWINKTERKYPGTCGAYWDGDTIVYLDRLLSAEDGYLPTRVAPDEDGRYSVGLEFEWERLEPS